MYVVDTHVVTTVIVHHKSRRPVSIHNPNSLSSHPTEIIKFGTFKSGLVIPTKLNIQKSRLGPCHSYNIPSKVLQQSKRKFLVGIKPLGHVHNHALILNKSNSVAWASTSSPDDSKQVQKFLSGVIHVISSHRMFQNSIKSITYQLRPGSEISNSA